MILVVGGAGYIGSHTVKRLHESGYKTVVFDNLSLGHRDFVKWGAFFEGDLCNKSDIESCFELYPITAVMHFSALANVGESVREPALYYRNNVMNTLNLLEVMQDRGVTDFIFSSTCATYGEPQSETLSESHVQNPINPYGRSKLMVEEIVKDMAKATDLNYTFLRYFNAAGADLDGEVGERHNPETHLIPLAIQAVLGRRDELTVFGDDYATPDGSCIRDYIHVTDLADAHILALKRLSETGESDYFNLGTGVGYSVFDIINTVSEVAGKSVPYTLGARREGDPPLLVAQNDKAETVLGWRPQITDLKVIIQSAYQFIISDSNA